MFKQQTLSPETKFILYSSRTQIDEDLIRGLKEIAQQSLNWKNILETAKQHAVAPLIYNNINKFDFLHKNIPENILSDFKKSYYITLTKNIRLWNEFSNILNYFQAQGIEIIPFKGIILGEILYHDIALRPLGADIDILIKKQDVDMAFATLNKLGYQLTLAKPSHEIIFQKNHFRLDVHKDALMPYWLNNIDTDGMRKRSQIKTIHGKKIKIFSKEDMLLTLPLQIRYDLPMFFLFRLCDINELLSQYRDCLDWPYILNSAKKYNIKSPLYFGLDLCRKFLFSAVPEKVLKELSISIVKRNLLAISLPNIACQGLLNINLGHKNKRLRAWVIKTLLIDNLKEWLKIVLYNIKKGW